MRKWANGSGPCELIFPEEVDRVMAYINEGYPNKLVAKLLGMSYYRVRRCVTLARGYETNRSMESRHAK
jgi:hypothetical protein